VKTPKEGVRYTYKRKGERNDSHEFEIFVSTEAISKGIKYLDDYNKKNNPHFKGNGKSEHSTEETVEQPKLIGIVEGDDGERRKDRKRDKRPLRDGVLHSKQERTIPEGGSIGDNINASKNEL